MGRFEEALEKYAKYVIQQARTNLTKKGNKDGKLYNSLSYKIEKGKVSFLGEKYGVYQDEGVKGSKSTYPESRTSPFKYTHKMPPPKVFDKWIVRKGIAPRDKEGRFITRQSLKFAISGGIYKKGIRASMFFTKPFERAFPKFKDAIVNGFIDDNLK